MTEEERWRVLCDSDTETFLNGCSLMSSTKSRVVRVICDGPWKLVPASMLFALSFPRSFDLAGFLELWALALHGTAPVKLMMNLLCVQGLRDVSLSSCLFTDQYRLQGWCMRTGGATHGNCVGRSCFEFVDARLGLISWSSLRSGWHWH